MSKLSVSDAIVQALENEGVEHIFIGPPGEHVVELYDSLADSKQITGYLTTNEYTLSFMADGYSRSSGKVGVFTCVPGPGITNALTGIAEAFTDSSPVVGIVTDVRSMIEEAFQLHEIPQMDLAAAIIKKSFRITDPDDAAKTVTEAFQLARSGEPGPVLIEVPCDVYVLRTSAKASTVATPPSTPDPQVISQFAELLRSGKQCGLYVGRGCIDYTDQVLDLSQRLQAPVASSISGRGIVPDDYSLSVGFGFGANGSKISQEVFKDCDVVLAIGCKFGEVSSGSYSFKLPKTFIHVDINPNNLNRVHKTDYALACDAGLFLTALLQELADTTKSDNKGLKERIEQGKSNFFESISSAPRLEDAVDPGKLYLSLRRHMAADDTLTVDIGNHELWAISCFSVLQSRTFLCPTNFSAMGFSIPAAIAAQILHPKSRTVCCVGDGGFLMSGFEILTAIRHKLPVIFLVFNDGALGITKGLQKRLFRRSAYVDLNNPNYQDLARSMGLTYALLSSDANIEPVLDDVWSKQEPILVEIRVSYDKMSPFLKGMVWHRMKVTPTHEKLHFLRRIVRRLFLPVESA